MRIPRDISATDLIKKLKPFGYSLTRQTGSHVRLTTEINGVHHITIPNHKPLRIGTISSILAEISKHFKLSRAELMNQIFSK